MRSLHVIHGLTVGGAERDLINKLIALRDTHGHTPEVLVLRRRGALTAALETRGIPVHGPLLRGLWDATGIARLARRIQRGPWDIVHGHLWSANMSIATALGFRTPSPRPPAIIFSEHALPDRQHPVQRHSDRVLQSRAHRFLVPSETARRTYLAYGLAPDRVHVMPNGIRSERFTRAAPAPARTGPGFVVGSLCRLEAIKGLEHLIDAVAQMDAPIHLRIGGEGPLEAALKRRAAPAGDRIRFLGRIDDAPSFYRSLDAFVLPSLSESFGMVLAEALLSEIPVIATRVGAVPEILEGGRFGVLVPPAAPGALADAIDALRRDPPRAATRRTAQIAMQNKYDIARVAAELAGLYAEIHAPLKTAS